MHIGEVLKQIRLKRGLTQLQVCKKIKAKGQTYLSLVEKGHREPSREFVKLLSKAYGVPGPVIEFMALDEKSVPKHKREAFSAIQVSLHKLINKEFDLGPDKE